MCELETVVGWTVTHADEWDGDALRIAMLSSEVATPSPSTVTPADIFHGVSALKFSFVQGHGEELDQSEVAQASSTQRSLRPATVIQHATRRWS